MKEEIDCNTGDKWIELSKEEIKMGFLAQCTEALAEDMKCDYTLMFNRLEAVNMTKGYILKFYEPLHTQSWEYIAEDIKKLLLKRESI